MMEVVVYLIPAMFSAVMLINGAIRYWGYFDKASMEAMFYHYIPSKREERNWKLSQKIFGKNLLIAGVLNVLTEVALIPVTNRLLDTAESSDSASIGMLLIMLLLSLLYMFGAWMLMQFRLKHLEDADKRGTIGE